MPQASEHEDQAERNEEFAQKINDDYSAYDDWVVNSKFYAAVHYIDYVLANDRRYAGDHKERRKLMSNSRSVSKRAYTVYKDLYDLSIETRYECIDVKSRHITRAERCLNNLKSELGI